MLLFLLFVPVLMLGVGTVLTRRATHTAEAAWPPRSEPLRIDGLAIHHIDLGPRNAPPVILLHGAFGTLEDWTATVVDPLLAAGFRVVAFDRPGHGYSERPTDTFGLAAQAQVLGHATETLGVGPAILCGFSFGGAVALAWALDDPDSVAALVLVNAPSHPWRTGHPASYDLLANPVVGTALAETLAGPLSSLFATDGVAKAFAPEPPLPAYLERAPIGLTVRPDSLRNNAIDIRELESELETMVPRYRDLAMPIRMLVSTEDEVVSPTIHSIPLQRVTSDSRRIEVPAAGHQLPWTRPELVAETIEDARRAAERR